MNKNKLLALNSWDLDWNENSLCHNEKSTRYCRNIKRGGDKKKLFGKVVASRQ